MSTPSTPPTPDPERLRAQVKGTVLTARDPGFEEAASRAWNAYASVARRPELLVRVAEEADVAPAVRFARASGLKVAVRGGAHHWANPTLRRGGLLIDLSALDRVVSIDAQARLAVVQPLVSNRAVQAALNAHGLSYPSGHCPPVKLSGYLLSGGMSWNQGVWGPGVAGVEAIELVTPRGEAIVADAARNRDWFWAARGAGPGFFGVATRYHLRLEALPRSMAASSYAFRVSEAGVLARWLDALAPTLSPKVELSLFLLTAPPEPAAKLAPEDAGRMSLVTATVFADTPEEAQTLLAPLEELPGTLQCLERAFARPVAFPELFDASGALWPEGRRNHVEAMFSNAPLGELFDAVQGHFLAAPSPESLFMMAVFTGPDVPAPLPDAAFSMSARFYGGPWTMWTDPARDQANTAWHDECLRLLRPFLAGHYIGETDIVRFPEHVRASFTPEHWTRLEALRARHDPDSLFFSYFDGLN